MVTLAFHFPLRKDKTMNTLHIFTAVVAVINVLLLAPIAHFLLTIWIQRSALAKVLSLSIKHPSLARALIMVCITDH